MITKNLQTAIDGLVIQDVYLRNSVARCEDEFEPKYTADFSGFQIQEMHVVKQAGIFELEDVGQLLRVTITLGVRWVQPQGDQEEPKILAFIEADFVAEYNLQTKLEQECIDEFAQKNASYHVWPYWREFLASQCERMRLPRMVVPAMQLAHHRRQKDI